MPRRPPKKPKPSSRRKHKGISRGIKKTNKGAKQQRKHRPPKAKTYKASSVRFKHAASQGVTYRIRLGSRLPVSDERISKLRETTRRIVKRSPYPLIFIKLVFKVQGGIYESKIATEDKDKLVTDARSTKVVVLAGRDPDDTVAELFDTEDGVTYRLERAKIWTDGRFIELRRVEIVTFRGME